MQQDNKKNHKVLYVVTRKMCRTYLLLCMHAQSCLTLCDPGDCSLPGSSVHGIFQARILEWVAISSSRRSSCLRELNPHLLHWQVDSLPLTLLVSPFKIHSTVKKNKSTKQCNNLYLVLKKADGEYM